MTKARSGTRTPRPRAPSPKESSCTIFSAHFSSAPRTYSRPRCNAASKSRTCWCCACARCSRSTPPACRRWKILRGASARGAGICSSAVRTHSRSWPCTSTASSNDSAWKTSAPMSIRAGSAQKSCWLRSSPTSSGEPAFAGNFHKSRDGRQVSSRPARLESLAPRWKRPCIS